jgi:hypothetical protein
MSLRFRVFMKSTATPVSNLVRPVLGLLTLTLVGAARAQPATTDASSAVSIPSLVSEITNNNPERRFYQEEIVAAKSGLRIAGRLSDPSVSLDLGRSACATRRARKSAMAPFGPSPSRRHSNGPAASRCGRPSPTVRSTSPNSASPASKTR